MQAIQLVKVYNRSGKVISNKKHFVSLYDEAKAAYLERKTELKAARAEKQAKKNKSSSSRTPSPPKLPRRPSWSTQAGDDFYKPHEPGRPNMVRGDTDALYEDAHFAHQQDIDELNHSHTSDDFETMAALHPELYDPHSNYAEELPPPLPTRPNPSVQDELRTKMTALQTLLMEANCVGTSAKSVVKTLEKDPDKMAAVALALAEISNLLRKMAPGVLLSMKGSFPAIVALLLSSEFLIAAGVGVGVTVVAFGGYMVVKKIQAKQKQKKEKKAAEAAMLTPTQELSEVEEVDDREIDIESIHQWRRGVTEEDARSLGTSVDGEYITEAAAKILAQQQQQQQEWERMPQEGRRTPQPKQHVPQENTSPTQQGLLAEGTKERMPWETVIQRAKSPAMAVKAFMKRDK